MVSDVFGGQTATFSYRSKHKGRVKDWVCGALACCDILFCTVVRLVLKRQQNTWTTLEEMLR